MTARSWFAPATGRARPVLIAVPPAWPKNFPSLPPALGVNPPNPPRVRALPIRAVYAAPAKPTPTKPEQFNKADGFQRKDAETQREFWPSQTEPPKSGLLFWSEFDF